MRALIAGLGSIGHRHLRNLKDLGVETFAYRTGLGPGKYDISAESVKVFDNLDDALGVKPDAVFITNPTALHVPVAIAAAEQGCHLFIEKPLSGSLEQLDRLSQLVRERSLIAMIGCNMRFHPGIRRMRGLLDHLGKIISARLEFGEYLPGWHPNEDYSTSYAAQRKLGGGAILTLIHEIDYAYWFFGPVERVTAFAATRSDLVLDVEDVAEILLQFYGGVFASIHLDLVRRPASRKCEIVGERAVIEWDYYTNRLVLYESDGSTKIFRDEFQRNEMYVKEVEHFLRCLQGAERPLIPLSEGIDVLKIALAARESARNSSVIHFDRPVQQVGS